MTNIQDICDGIGRGRVADVLGVSRQAVSNAISEGRFPATWYLEIKKEANKVGMECPESLFAFRKHEAAKPEGSQ